MNDANVATKEDIKMILEAVNQGFKEVDERFKQVDERFEQVDKRFEASDQRTAILIEDLEERVLGCKNDQVSLHQNKLDNHEVRIRDCPKVSVNEEERLG